MGRLLVVVVGLAAGVAAAVLLSARDEREAARRGLHQPLDERQTR